jgi:Zn-dependent protease with chaperone function
MSTWMAMLIDLPYVPAVLVKVTLLLACAWVAHGALRGRNPRWRVLLWRGVLVAVVALPVAEWALPRLEVAILEEPVPPQPAARVVTELEPMPFDVALPDVPLRVAEPRPAPAPPMFNLRAWATEHVVILLGAGWGLIALVLLAGMGRGWLRVCRTIAQSQPAPNSVRALADSIARDLDVYSKVEAASCRFNAAGRRVHLAVRALESIARDLGVYSKVEAASCRLNAAGRRVHLDVRVVEDLGSPFLTGIRRPIIVLPARCLRESDPAQLRAILAHEVAHVKSRDPFWLAFGRVASSLLWFHPLMWRVTTAHSAACEEVCDGVAAAYLGSAQSYSKALAREALALHTAHPAPGGVPMLRTAEIVRRLQRIQGGIVATPLTHRRVSTGVAAAGLLLIALGSLRFVRAETPTQERAASSPKDAIGFVLPTASDAVAVAEQRLSQDHVTRYVPGDGLPAKTSDGESFTTFKGIAIADDGAVIASAVTSLTNIALFEFRDGAWTTGDFFDMVTRSKQHNVAAVRTGRVYRQMTDGDLHYTAIAMENSDSQYYAFKDGVWHEQWIGQDRRLTHILPLDVPVLSLAAGSGGAVAVGTADALYLRPNGTAEFEEQHPADDRHSWAPRDVGALTFDSTGRLWIGCSLGAGVWDGRDWRLFTSDDGLADHHFTCAAAGPDGAVWFGTEHGVMYYDATGWIHRGSDQWLPDDQVNDIAIEKTGTAWIATKDGIARIRRT